MRELEGMSPEISLLHMNCEGCEWEMLETLLKDPDVISKVTQVLDNIYKYRKAYFLTTPTGEVFTNWHPLFSRGKAVKMNLDASILISVGAEPEQAILRDPRSIEFDS